MFSLGSIQIICDTLFALFYGTSDIFTTVFKTNVNCEVNKREGIFALEFHVFLLVWQVSKVILAKSWFSNTRYRYNNIT